MISSPASFKRRSEGFLFGNYLWSRVVISRMFFIEFFIEIHVGDCSLGHSLSLLWILGHYSLSMMGFNPLDYMVEMTWLSRVVISRKSFNEFFIDILVGDCSLGHSLSLLWILDHNSRSMMRPVCL